MKSTTLSLLSPLSPTLDRTKRSKATVKNVLAAADIRINGDRPWDIRVHDEDLYSRVLADGSLGLGEAYMDGWWDTEQPDVFFTKILRSSATRHVPWNARLLWDVCKFHFFNEQSRARAFQVGEKHYDIGNDLYEAMLDPYMIYSCAYWKDASTLAEAQEKKLDLLCRKLKLQPGETILDIGCGWGGFAAYAAKKYGARVVGVTISKRQAAFARERWKGLPIDIRLQDYRDLNERFDRIVSVGMFEHVGPHNYRTYMNTAHRCLKDGGLFVLQTIGNNAPSLMSDPWIATYIFPNGVLPALSQITTAAEGRFIVEDLQNAGTHYDRTLMHWYENVRMAWPTLKKTYDERFYRMWTYYLLSCAGLFRARQAQLWQIVLSKEGAQEGYVSVR